MKSVFDMLCISGLSKSAGSFSQPTCKPAADWDCDVCLVPNKGEASKCIACESPRPGSQPSATGRIYNYDM